MTRAPRLAALERGYLRASGGDLRPRELELPRSRLRVHLLEGGAGPPVLWLHGANFVGASFEPLLSRLGKGYRILAPDRPGCGQSDSFAPSSGALGSLSGALMEELFEALDLERARVVGASMGGYLALRHALDHPARYERLVLLGPPPGIERRVPFPLRLLATPGLNRLLFSTVARPSVAATRHLLTTAMVSRPEAVPEGLPPLLTAAQEAPGATESWRVLLEDLLTFRGVRPERLLHDLLPRLRVPVGMVWGAEDGITPPSRGEAVARRIPALDLRVVEGAGHLVWLDAPEETAEHLAALLSSPAP